MGVLGVFGVLIDWGGLAKRLISDSVWGVTFRLCDEMMVSGRPAPPTAPPENELNAMEGPEEWCGGAEV